MGFLVQLESGVRLQAHVFVVYDEPQPAEAAGKAGATQFAWRVVTRGQCCKGCEGRVLRSIQRFGRASKRTVSDVPVKSMVA